MLRIGRGSWGWQGGSRWVGSRLGFGMCCWFGSRIGREIVTGSWVAAVMLKRRGVRKGSRRRGRRWVGRGG